MPRYLTVFIAWRRTHALGFLNCSMPKISTSEKILCAHCGDACLDNSIQWRDHIFCCNGCEMVYAILHENGMEAYYQLEDRPGLSQRGRNNKSFEYLDDPSIKEKLVAFSEGGLVRISFSLPQIHCSSCLWLLENLHRLAPGIRSSRVNFQKKEATVVFLEQEITLRQLVELLTKIGYEPELNWQTLEEKKPEKIDRSLLYKLGLSGFAFGNIMLLSFPEYLGFERAAFHFFIGYINIILALPVLLYSGSDYLRSAWRGIQLNRLNIDVPVALGMLALFSRSVYEILSGTGEGYLDSFAGFVFFLLIGRWFQAITYRSIHFDRNYKSYFPISVAVLKGGEWIAESLDKLEKGMQIMVKHQEIIPADGVLLSDEASLDYSFVTGESDPIRKESGEKVLAGGKQTKGAIRIELSGSVDQSYLTQLWKEEVFEQNEASATSRMVERISKYFTWIVLGIAALSFAWWYQVDPGIAFRVVTAVLIVACPCALALAIPFTYGNILRILSKQGFYLRNTATVEHLQDFNHIVFDKTGTITDSTGIQLQFEGPALSLFEKSWIKSTCQQSNHPLSRAIARQLAEAEDITLDQFSEISGKGVHSSLDGRILRLGSEAFIFEVEQQKIHGVHVEIDSRYKGVFHVEQALRENVQEIINHLDTHFELSMLSGDNEEDEERMVDLFGNPGALHFHQSPGQKLAYIRNLQKNGEQVLMIGDGLNDAGALKQSNVGMVISDQANNFSPACDAILNADQFPKLLGYLRYLRSSRGMIYGAFVLAFLYNLIGMYFAVTGQLSPVIAAILMPLSSLTVIGYGLGISNLFFHFVQRDEKST